MYFIVSVETELNVRHCLPGVTYHHRNAYKHKYSNVFDFFTKINYTSRPMTTHFFNFKRYYEKHLMAYTRVTALFSQPS